MSHNRNPNSPSLADHPALDDAELIEQILDTTERDSVIEGLPAFTPEFRKKLRADLQNRLASEPTESDET